MYTESNTHKAINAGDVEHIASLTLGGIFLALGLTRGGIGGLLFKAGGAALLWRGVQGYEPVRRAVGLEFEKRPTGVGLQNVRVESIVTIDRSPEEVYRIWRNFENLPVFMSNLVSVEEIDDTRSHWVAKAPAGMVVEWDAEIVNDIENELIAWQTLEGSSVDSAGSVHFEPGVDGGTRLRVVLRYDPPADNLGASIAKLFRMDPQTQIDQDLERFKRIMEVPNAHKPVSAYEGAQVI